MWQVYWITSSARRSRDGGIVRPSALTVLRSRTSSCFVGCSTGRAAGLVPLRILSTDVVRAAMTSFTIFLQLFYNSFMTVDEFPDMLHTAVVHYLAIYIMAAAFLRTNL